MSSNSFAVRLGEMRASVANLMEPRPAVYWADFLMTMGLAWASYGVAVCFRDRALIFLVSVGLSSIFFYRGLAFTHELVHMGRRAVPGFDWGWHLLCGVPMLAPHFLYRGVHLTHHSKKYASREDGEYVGFGRSSRWLIVGHFLYNAVLPALSIVRFVIIAPLSIMNARLRAVVVRKVSFMGLRFSLEREGPRNARESMEWWLGELGCSAFAWGVVAGIALGRIPALSGI